MWHSTKIILFSIKKILVKGNKQYHLASTVRFVFQSIIATAYIEIIFSIKKKKKKKHFNFLYIILFAGYLRMNLSSVQTNVEYKSFLYNDMKWNVHGDSYFPFAYFHSINCIFFFKYLLLSATASFSWFKESNVLLCFLW